MTLLSVTIRAAQYIKAVWVVTAMSFPCPIIAYSFSRQYTGGQTSATVKAGARSGSNGWTRINFQVAGIE